MQSWYREPSSVTVNGLRLAYHEISPLDGKAAEGSTRDAREGRGQASPLPSTTPLPRGTILLLTGLAAKRYGWYRQIDVFGRYYRTIALDHRDIGDSDEVDQFYKMIDLADDAAGALQVLGVERANVVGISMGGFVSLNLALRHPELVEKLVLVATSAGGSSAVQAGAETLGAINRPLQAERGVEPGEIARRTYSKIMYPGYAETHPEEMENIAQIARYRPQSFASYMRQLQAIATHDVAQQLSCIHAPTLAIHGAADPLVPPANGEYLARHIPGAKLIMYQHAGHVPIIENADQFNRDVLEFLENS